MQLPVSANLRRSERNKSFHMWYAWYVFSRYKLEFRYISYVVDIVGYIIITAFLQSHGFALPEVMLGTGFTRFPAFSSWSIDLLQNTEDIARLCRSHTSHNSHHFGTTGSTQKATLRAAWAPSCRAGNLGTRDENSKLVGRAFSKKGNSEMPDAIHTLGLTLLQIQIDK